MRARLPSSSKLISGIDMSGFLSIQTALLSMFIFLANNWHDLPMNSTDLPKAVHSVSMPKANREDAIIIAIQRDGTTWLGYDRVSPDELQTRIRET